MLEYELFKSLDRFGKLYLQNEEITVLPEEGLNQQI